MALIPMGFPDYVYREYPKYIAHPDGSGILAEHAQHEAEIRAGFPVPAKSERKAAEKQPEPPAEQTADGAGDAAEEMACAEAIEAERQMLLQECVSRGIKVHRKTGIAKLKAALA